MDAAGQSQPTPFADDLAAPAVFDRAAALDRVDGDEEFLAALIAMVRDEIPGIVALLALAFAEDNAAAVGEHAHSIKGIASAVGAMALTQVAAEIEQAARAGQLPSCRRSLERLNGAFAEFSSACRGEFIRPEMAQSGE